MRLGTSGLGTRVRCILPLAPGKTLEDVFGEYTEDNVFSRTRTVVRLFAVGVEFVSRSEARRLISGLEKFREVVLDFARVSSIGQGFADEVFRVWALRHPGTVLTSVNADAAVAFMIGRALATR